VIFELLCHCLTDAAIDVALADISAGIGQAVLRAEGGSALLDSCRYAEFANSAA
jgi:hypothetical protein